MEGVAVAGGIRHRARTSVSSLTAFPPLIEPSMRITRTRLSFKVMRSHTRGCAGHPARRARPLCNRPPKKRTSSRTPPRVFAPLPTRPLCRPTHRPPPSGGRELASLPAGTNRLPGESAPARVRCLSTAHRVPPLLDTMNPKSTDAVRPELPPIHRFRPDVCSGCSPTRRKWGMLIHPQGHQLLWKSIACHPDRESRF